jgi:hypothetical protein
MRNSVSHGKARDAGEKAVDELLIDPAALCDDHAHQN